MSLVHYTVSGLTYNLALWPSAKPLEYLRFRRIVKWSPIGCFYERMICDNEIQTQFQRCKRYWHGLQASIWPPYLSDSTSRISWIRSSHCAMHRQQHALHVFSGICYSLRILHQPSQHCTLEPPLCARYLPHSAIQPGLVHTWQSRGLDNT